MGVEGTQNMSWNPRESWECSCASRSGAGKPAFDLCKFARNMVFRFDKVNDNQSETHS